jgi:hypothetical protein
VRVQVTTRLRRRRIFSTSCLTQERKKNWVPTSYLQEEDKICRRVFFVLRVAQIKKVQDFLYDKLLTRAMEVRESRGSLWVCQGWSNVTEESVRKLGREKKETKEGEKVAPAKATFRVSQTKNSFFWFTSIGVLRDPSRLKYRLLHYFFTMKPCAKEVSESDYLTQQKQYLKRTTLRRLKIPLQTICSKEGPHHCLSKAWARKLSSDKWQSTFIHELEIPLVIPYLGYTA